MPIPIIKRNTKCLIDALNICPTNVFGISKGKVFVENKNDCIGCKACEAHCNEIEVQE